jgi:hypothetical protein
VIQVPLPDHIIAQRRHVCNVINRNAYMYAHDYLYAQFKKLSFGSPLIVIKWKAVASIDFARAAVMLFYIVQKQ